jgi:hypothetical protein
MKTSFLAILLIFVGALGLAQAAEDTLTISWVAPTQRTDGTALPLSQLSGFRVDWGTCTTATPPAFGTQIGTATTTMNTDTEYSTGVLSPATYCVRVYANATDGTVSASSNIASKTIFPPPSPPKPATNVTVK